MTAGLLLFEYVTTERMWLLVPLRVTFGLGRGSCVTTRITLVRGYFGRESFGTILGFTMGIMMFGSMIGPPLAGWVYDNFGSYQGIWFAFIGVLAAGITSILTTPAAPQKGRM